jgi:aminoglycoside phosphotransferase (APT) family kinase protein
VTWSSDAAASRIREGLAAWLPAQLGTDCVEVEHPEPISSVGGARRPWLVGLRWEDAHGRHATRAVLLVKVPDGQLETALAPEFAALRHLHPRGVAVARPLVLDAHGEAFGQAFFATEWMPGTARLDLLRLEPGDPHGRAVALGMADAAAVLHTVAVRDPPAELGPRVDAARAVTAQLDEWEDRFLRQRMEPLPLVAHAFGWLRANTPAATRVSFVHGDFRLGNVLYDGDRVRAMLDWEMVHLGDPLEDLAWAHRTRWSLERLLPVEEFLDRYHERSGIAVDPARFRWHRMFAEVKHTVISLTAARSFADGRTTWLRHADRASMAAPFMTRFLAMEQEHDAAVVTA